MNKTNRTQDLVNLQVAKLTYAVETRSVHLPNSLAAELRVKRVSYSSLACLIGADLASDFPMAELLKKGSKAGYLLTGTRRSAHP